MPTSPSAAQQTALTDLFARILQAPSSFYRSRLTTAGVRNATEVDVNVLARLPLTRRAEILRDQLDHPPHGTRRFADAALPVRTGISGSGSDLLVLTWPASDLALERAAGVRLFNRLGVTATMRIANALPGALATPGALLLGDVVEELGGLDVPLGAIDSDAAGRQAWELVDRVQPNVLVLDHTTATRLLPAAPPRERGWWQGIVWLQRSNANAESPSLPEPTGFTGWQRTWLAVPEATSFFAHSCAAGRYHIDEGVVAEIVDEETGAVMHDGEEGTVAVTPLGGETPLLRYASGLRARATSHPCACDVGGTVVEMRS